MRNVVLFGNGPNASANRFYLEHDSQLEVVAFTVDRDYLREEHLDGLPVVAFDEVEQHFPPAENAMIIPIGYVDLNRPRAERAVEAHDKGYELVTYVNSSSAIWPEIEIGNNCFVYENCVVKPFAKIGNNVILEAGSMIGHHAVIGDHCFVAPNAVILGRAEIGPYSFIGANATIGHGARIGRECIIGAGATVMRNTRPGQVYVARGTQKLAQTSEVVHRMLSG